MSGEIVSTVRGWPARRRGNSRRASRLVTVRILVRWSAGALVGLVADLDPSRGDAVIAAEGITRAL
ncbi:hypothetical protein ACFHW0_25155 [Micromonospora sp. LOL_025]|uniref:hypothetical protein n=1 Tax=Micromonospora sp. LOL_025 TaxID=3345413 RepID=UPI003A89F7AF